MDHLPNPDRDSNADGVENIFPTYNHYLPAMDWIYTGRYSRFVHWSEHINFKTS